MAMVLQKVSEMQVSNLKQHKQIVIYRFSLQVSKNANMPVVWIAICLEIILRL